MGIPNREQHTISGRNTQDPPPTSITPVL
jgi:DNA invertase Pin-like site-specific DNA recombinase